MPSLNTVRVYTKFKTPSDSKIFMPTFDNKVEDDNALARFEEIFGSGNVIPVPSKDIAMGGGVLNCLTWEIQT
jgi:agmatine deiminase